ncbi:NAD-dependent epimerase/dehydratase family protein [Desulfomarina profundi]|nr:NAD-dependent epimerase/dehydratase family protein [Desulfomarina profundi]
MEEFTVYGSTGIIGSHVTRYLEKNGFSVNTPDRDEVLSFSTPLGHVLYCIGVTADFRNRPIDTVQAHVCVLSEILRRGDFTSLLYLSSTRIYSGADSGREDARFSLDPSDPSDLYNLSKLMGESLCLQCGRKGVKIARLSNVVGDGTRVSRILYRLSCAMQKKGRFCFALILHRRRIISISMM